MIKAIIFDFDGVILETETPIFKSWNELYQSYGCEIPLDSWVTLIGGTDNDFDPFTELERQVGHKLDESVIEPPRQLREKELVEVQAVLPGVTQYINDARKLHLKIGVASSSPNWWVSGHLSRLGLDHYFDFVCTRDNVEHVKPYPDLYLKVLETFDVRSDEAIAVEDSPNGVTAAKKAGLFCVAVPNAMTRSLCLNHADMKLNSLVELPLSEVIARAKNNHR